MWLSLCARGLKWFWCHVKSWCSWMSSSDVIVSTPSLALQHSCDHVSCRSPPPSAPLSLGIAVSCWCQVSFRVVATLRVVTHTHTRRYAVTPVITVLVVPPVKPLVFHKLAEKEHEWHFECLLRWFKMISMISYLPCFNFSSKPWARNTGNAGFLVLILFVGPFSRVLFVSYVPRRLACLTFSLF